MGKIVPFEGPTNAKIYLVGEAPGSAEEEEGRPFVGGSGRLLNRLLMEAGLVREECRIGNVMRVRPPGNKFSHFYSGTTPTPELEEGRTYLLDDIRRTNPNVIVAFGNEPLKTLTGESSVTNWRGSVLFPRKVGCKVIPTFHPAFLLRAWSNVPLTLFDLRRAYREAKTPTHINPTYRLELRPTFNQVCQRLSWIREGRRKVAFDVETDEDRHITALAFAWSGEDAICIPFTNSTGAPYWTIEHEEKVWEMVRGVLDDPSVLKILHNAQFDCIMTQINPSRSRVEGMWMDTMVAFHTVYPEIAASEKEGTTGTMKHKIGGGKKLALLSSIYTNQPYYKHLGHSGNDMKFWEYNCIDTIVTYQCAERLEGEMKEFEVWDFYHTRVHPLLRPLMEMQMRGVRIDHSIRVKAMKAYEEEANRLQDVLNRAAGYVVNVNSPSQLKDFLYYDLGFPEQRQGRGGKVTTNAMALDTLSTKYPSPVFDLILRIRRNRKLVGTYLNEEGGDDGRMRCSYIVGGTETGRLASRSSVFGSGTNLQNFPHGICRRMLPADEGKVMIAADLAQAEARIVAYEAEELAMIHVFETGGDIHQLSADALPSFFVPVGNEFEGVANPRRLFAKKHVHAFNYGEGVVMFARRARLPVAEARAIRDGYFARFPRIQAWQLSIQSSLNRSRTITTPHGRRRTFFGMWGESLFREAYAYIPQSTVGDITNIAIIRLHQMRDDLFEPLLTTHDEIVIQCNDDPFVVQHSIRALERAFHIPVVVKGREVVVPVEVKVGRNWEDLYAEEVWYEQ